MKLPNCTELIASDENYTHKSAVISNCGKYRYALTREWSANRGVTFIGLNPSTADAMQDDPTIRKCVHFAKREGFGSMLMLNLFAFRATNPKEIRKTRGAYGPENGIALNQILEHHEPPYPVILMWGANGAYMESDEMMLAMLGADPRLELFCFGKTLGGHPCHPLYLRNDTTLKPW